MWDRITRRGPQSGTGYNCDKSLQVMSSVIYPLTHTSLQVTWYRFEGEAGSQLADIRDPPRWEECGTSKVQSLSIARMIYTENEEERENKI